MSQTLLVGDSKEEYQFNDDFIKSYNEDSNIGFFIEADVQYLKELHELHNDLHFLSKIMKIEKVEKLVANLHDKKEFVILIRTLKDASNHELVLKKVYRVIKFNQKAWLKSYININMELRKKAKYNFEKYFF